jgi:hypothetical protein
MPRRPARRGSEAIDEPARAPVAVPVTVTVARPGGPASHTDSHVATASGSVTGSLSGPGAAAAAPRVSLALGAHRQLPMYGSGSHTGLLFSDSGSLSCRSALARSIWPVRRLQVGVYL